MPAHATDDHVEWRRGGGPPAVSVEPVLHLAVDWFDTERAHVGRVARLDAPAILGRGDRAEGDPPFLEFLEVRPGETRRIAPLGTGAISRRQLLFEPVEDGKAVRVERLGKRPLFHRGVAATECVARPGDTLVLES